MALFLILPTSGPRTYRGKRPTFPRSISAGATGLHVELYNGVRLWAAPGFAPAELPKLDSDFADILESAPAMTAEQYGALLEAADVLRGRLAERRDNGAAWAELQSRAHAMAAAIPNDANLAERNAKNRRAALLAEDSPRVAFDPDKPFRVYSRGPWGQVCFDFATFPEAQAYLTGQAERRAFVTSGAAPAGPHGDSIDPLASFIVWPEGVATLADMGWTPEAKPGRLWIRPEAARVDSGIFDPLGGLRGTGELIPETLAERAGLNVRAIAADNGPAFEAAPAETISEGAAPVDHFARLAAELDALRADGIEGALTDEVELHGKLYFVRIDYVEEESE